MGAFVFLQVKSKIMAGSGNLLSDFGLLLKKTQVDQKCELKSFCILPLSCSMYFLRNAI